MKNKIPKIIHQVWIQGQDQLPVLYHTWQKSFKKINPSYDYKLWDDISIKNLLKKHFPDLLQIYNNLPYVVQKADLARYAILYIYGGVYCDMDSECLKPFDKLINDKFFCYKRDHIATMNHVIGAIPNHPIMKICLDLIQERHTIPKIPHLYICYVTGTMMFNSAIDKYLKSNPTEKITRYGGEYFPVHYTENMKKAYVGHHAQCSFSLNLLFNTILNGFHLSI